MAGLGSTNRVRTAGLAAALTVCLLAGAAFWGRADADRSLVATVHKGTLTAQLSTSGTLRPLQSITYRSPLGGREAEITDLVPEGTHVSEGDLLVRLDTTELKREVERSRQEVRQSQMEVQVADIERQDAEDAIKSVAEGEGAVTVEEARTRLTLAQKKVDRLRQENDSLTPLMDKGFITRDEMKKTSDALEQAEEDLALARKRNDVLVDLTHPRDTQHAKLQLAQKESQLENARTRAQEADTRLKILLEQIENCSLYARRPGIVVYEEYLNVSPRRKIHVGDRVTGSQGLVTIPEVSRMALEGSVSEAEVHRVQVGQTAMIRAEAFAAARLTGKVTRIGTLARASADRPIDDKRFDLIIELDPTDVDLRPEMTARADILVGTRQDVLLVPVNAVFQRQGRFVAHVIGAGGVDTRPIDIGESNDVFIEVTGGLREGDQVALTDRGAATPGAAGAAPQGNREGGFNRQVNALQPR